MRGLLLLLFLGIVRRQKLRCRLDEQPCLFLEWLRKQRLKTLPIRSRPREQETSEGVVSCLDRASLPVAQLSCQSTLFIFEKRPAKAEGFEFLL